MARRRCELCGRRLRTGRKYCYSCKSEGYHYGSGGSEMNDRGALVVGLTMIIWGVGLYFWNPELIGITIILIFFGIGFCTLIRSSAKKKAISLRKPERRLNNWLNRPVGRRY